MVLGFGHLATSVISFGETRNIVATSSKRKLAAKNKRLCFVGELKN
jgi:hypothetical protein